MRSVSPIQVGVEIVEPNWAMVCVSLTGHAMRALGYLEADRPDLALAALNEARGVVDLRMMVRQEELVYGGHVFNNGVCECGQRSTDDPVKCTAHHFQ